MVEHTFSIPDDLNPIIAQQAKHWGGIDSYLMGLVQQDLQATEKLKVELQKGLDSGISDRSLDDIWQKCKSKHTQT